MEADFITTMEGRPSCKEYIRKGITYTAGRSIRRKISRGIVLLISLCTII